MLTSFPLFDNEHLSSLIDELRRSMRRVLAQLCDELDGPYRQASQRLRIPVGYLRAVEATLEPEDFSHWKVVGWIEELNDLVYLLDVREQLRRESDAGGFAEAFYAACATQYYEHGYLDELFPEGRPLATKLAHRVSSLCEKLARQVSRESLFLVPGLPCRWLDETTQQQWRVPYDFGPNFERAEPADCIPFGLDGDVLSPSRSDRRHMCTQQAVLTIKRDGIDLSCGAHRIPLLVLESARQWRWEVKPTVSVLVSYGRMTMGPTLIYGKRRAPVRMTGSSSDLVPRLAHAVRAIETAWPEGANNLALLTSRIIPLQARGVVSFSYRHRPGLSFINCFDRDEFDLIDDLIHENSHHQLNLYLRKAELLRGEHTDEIFYSPWRRSLRPVRGILHATFTFTMGALLFDRLAASHYVTDAHRLRAQARCLEEVESVRYSLRDLVYAARQLGWLSESGVALVQSMAREIRRVHRRIALHESAIYSSHYGQDLKRHCDTLRHARHNYGPRL